MWFRCSDLKKKISLIGQNRIFASCLEYRFRILHTEYTHSSTSPWTDFVAGVPRLLCKPCQTHTHSAFDTRFVAFSDISLILRVPRLCCRCPSCGRTEKKCCFFINFNILPESNICDITTLTPIGAFPQCVPCQHSHILSLTHTLSYSGALAQQPGGCLAHAPAQM